MSQNPLRTVRIDRVSAGHFTATNVHGATVKFGPSSEQEFTPVELLLAALAGCTAMDVDYATSFRAEPELFNVTATGNKVGGAEGNRLTDLVVTFSVAFPEGSDGDAARAILPRAVKLSHDRTCTVSRTIEAGTPVTSVVDGP
jgi:putative redox protein